MQESVNNILDEYLKDLKSLSRKYYTDEVFDRDFNNLANFAKKELMGEGVVETVINTVVYDGKDVKGLMKFPDLPASSNERMQVFATMGEDLAHSSEYLFSIVYVFEAWIKLLPLGEEKPDKPIKDMEGCQEALCVSGVTLDGRTRLNIYTITRESAGDENSPVKELKLMEDNKDATRIDNLASSFIAGFLKVLFVNRFTNHA